MRLVLLIGLLLAGLGSAHAQTGIAVYGDSTARGDGAQTEWYDRLQEILPRQRPIHSAGINRNSISGLVKSVEADTEHRDWTVVFYDRRNAGESAEEWMEQIAAAIALLQTDRFLIMPQVPVSGGREDGLTLPVLLEINELVRATYPDNSFDADTEAEFLARLDDDATRADRIHRNDAGQQIEAEFIGAWLNERGW